VNKKLVFQSNDSVAQATMKYYAHFVVMGSISYLSIRTLADLGINVLLAKIATETLLFIPSFAIQWDFIFAKTGILRWPNRDDATG
jgi:hypothetical protein